MKEKLFKLEELTLEEKYYPRKSTSWQVAYEYANAMQTGSIFPPVLVGMYKGKNYLLDGWHRYEANKKNKTEYIKGVYKVYTNEKEIYLDSIIANSHHGKTYTFQEKLQIAIKLQDLNIDKAEISKIVGIPNDKLAKHLKIRTLTTPTGKKIIIKKPLIKAKQRGELDRFDVDEIEKMQSRASGHGFNDNIDNLILGLIYGSYELTKETKDKMIQVKTMIEEALGLAEVDIKVGVERKEKEIFEFESKLSDS